MRNCVNLADKEAARKLLKGLFEEKDEQWVEGLVQSKDVKTMGQIQMKKGQGSTISIDLSHIGG